MKKIILISLLTFLSIGVIICQNEQVSNKLGVGFQLNQFQKDFGLGINITSPYFAGNNVALRLRGNYMFFEHVKNNETIWTPYSNISLGILGGSIVKNFMRLYGEGGVIGILPSADFSSESFVMGGYGIFGFEFYMIENLNFFIEMGGIGTGATADKVANKPIYSSGFMMSTGIRMQLK
jgi:hypothetical protein